MYVCPAKISQPSHVWSRGSTVDKFADNTIDNNNTRLTALFWDYPGEQVPER